MAKGLKLKLRPVFRSGGTYYRQATTSVAATGLAIKLVTPSLTVDLDKHENSCAIAMRNEFAQLIGGDDWADDFPDFKVTLVESSAADDTDAHVVVDLGERLSDQAKAKLKKALAKGDKGDSTHEIFEQSQDGTVTLSAETAQRVAPGERAYLDRRFATFQAHDQKFKQRTAANSAVLQLAVMHQATSVACGAVVGDLIDGRALNAATIDGLSNVGAALSESAQAAFKLTELAKTHVARRDALLQIDRQHQVLATNPPLTLAERAELDHLNRTLAAFDRLGGKTAGWDDYRILGRARAQVYADLYAATYAQEQPQAQIDFDAVEGELNCLEPLRELQTLRAQIAALKQQPLPLSQTDQQTLEDNEAQEKGFAARYVRETYPILVAAEAIPGGVPLGAELAQRLADLTNPPAALTIHQQIELDLLNAAATNAGIPARHADFVTKLLQQEAAQAPDKNPLLGCEAELRSNPNFPQGRLAQTQQVQVSADGVSDALHDRCLERPGVTSIDTHAEHYTGVNGQPAVRTKPARAYNGHDHFQQYDALLERFNKYTVRVQARLRRVTDRPDNYPAAQGFATGMDGNGAYHPGEAMLRRLDAFSVDRPAGTIEAMRTRSEVYQARADRYFVEHRRNMRMSLNDARAKRSHGAVRAKLVNAHILDEACWPQVVPSAVADWPPAHGGQGAPRMPLDNVLNIAPDRNGFIQFVETLTGDRQYARNEVRRFSDAQIAAFLREPVDEVCSDVVKSYHGAQTRQLDHLGFKKAMPARECADWMKWRGIIGGASFSCAAIIGIGKDAAYSTVTRQFSRADLIKFNEARVVLFAGCNTPAQHQIRFNELNTQLQAESDWRNVLRQEKTGGLNLIKVADINGYPKGTLSTKRFNEVKRRLHLRQMKRLDTRLVKPIRDELKIVQHLMRKLPRSMHEALHADGIVSLPDITDRNSMLRAQQLATLRAKLQALKAKLLAKDADTGTAYGQLDAEQQASVDAVLVDVDKELARLDGEGSIQNAGQVCAQGNPDSLNGHQQAMLDLAQAQLTAHLQKFWTDHLGTKAADLNTSATGINANTGTGRTAAYSNVKAQIVGAGAGLPAGEYGAALTKIVQLLDGAAGDLPAQALTVAPIDSTHNVRDQLVVRKTEIQTRIDQLAAQRGAFVAGINTCHTTGEVQALRDKLVGIDADLITAQAKVTGLRKPQEDLQAKRVQIEGLEKQIADRERMQQQRLGRPGGGQEMEALLPVDGGDEEIDFEGLQGELATAKAEISDLEAAVTTANVLYPAAEAEQQQLEGEQRTTQTQIGISLHHLDQAVTAFDKRQVTERHELHTLKKDINALLANENFHDYEQQQALLLGSQLADGSAQQHAARAKLVLGATEGSQPRLHQVELADQYGQMMGGVGDDVAGARCQYAQSLYDDVEHEADDLQHDVDDFFDSQEQVLKSNKATNELGEKARKRRLDEIMKAVDVDAMKNEADLIKRAMKPWVSYFARSDQLLAKAQKALTPSRQHVSVDLQSAMSDALMRLILLLFLLLFAGLKKGFEKLGLGNRLTKAKDLALERLVLYRLKMNDGKLDLKALVDDLKDMAKKDELFMNAAGKSGVDIESQSDEIMLKAAKIAYMMGVPLEDIVGVGVGDPKKSPVHLSKASLAKFRAFVDDPQQQHDFGKRPVSYYDSSYQSKGQNWYEKMQNTWDDTIQFFKGGSAKVAPQKRSVIGVPDSMRTGGRSKGMTPAGGGGQPANPLQSLMGGH